MKSLYDISWQVSEDTYRQDKALSYSTLAKYERGGFNEIEHLFDKIESPSLLFGSCVDSIITGGYEEFNSRYLVAEFPKISDNLISVIKVIYDRCHESYKTLEEIPDNIVSQIAKELGFWKDDKWDARRAKEVKKEEGTHSYYSIMAASNDRTVISSFMYKDVMNAVDALKDKEATKYYFAPNSPFESVERFYQLKFKATLNSINYRCMADLIVVDHDKKTVQPVDLKTSSHFEWDFHKSFVTWNYQVQARLYWRIIRDVMDKDDFYKDYTLLDYKFIVVNKNTLDPLVWDFPVTRAKGTLTFPNVEMRDPEDIGKELDYYLNNTPKRPIGIYNENNIVEFLNKM